ncbi:ribosome maturation factor RimM [Gordonia amarae]|uniref:Ribosome maturation factor RimM n=2 Tax=Gordonia amarae TaxID=36821 RepID=G7GQ30_9ACTN|nr:ribosome maturation factor RimM [Gordonia amarae]MCS3878631.1 16S rRNA processing protein RimM [Gordonia amarae]QHN17226.1 ribosome maturation factor RimM [Gordonia amarae]QHN21752.1 ribosome maturation factor RimM [Gordonia amarae]QHN30603.1 ribosome maturation factor RimM [Gordonia amarae]QHN39380.1 ribosome maturation factor RimM [Gordonia amarae]
MDLVIGRVVKAHGIRGEVVVDVRTDDPDTRFACGAILRGQAPRGGGERRFTVTAARNHSGRLLLSLKEVGDRTAADALRGTLFVIDAADVDSGDDPDEFYDHELEGLPVTTVDGDPVGVVSSVLHLPANDILAVTAEDGRELLVPFVRDIVPEVTRDGGVVIDPPDGLFDQ